MERPVISWCRLVHDHVKPRNAKTHVSRIVHRFRINDVFPILSRLPTFLSAEGLLLGNGVEWDGVGVPGCDIVRSNYKLVYNPPQQIRNLSKDSLYNHS